MVDFITRLSSMSEEDRNYWLKHLPESCANPKKINRLFELLTNFDFLAIKITEIGMQKAITDFNLLSCQDVVSYDSYSSETTDALGKIQKSLQQSASILDADTQELPSRLWGHLGREQSPWIQKLLLQAIESKAKSDRSCWLRPLESNLSIPDTPLETTLTGHSGSVTSLAITSDGETIIAGSHNRILIWNLAAIRGYTISFSSQMGVYRQYDPLLFGDITAMMCHPRYVKALALTSDDSRLISGSDDGVIRVWDLKNRSLLQSREIFCSQFYSYDPEQLRQYIHHSKIVGEVVSPYNAINDLAFLPGTNLVAVGCEDGSVFLCNIDDGQLYVSYHHPDSVQAVITSADGELLITGSEESIMICNRTTNEIRTLHSNSRSWAAPFFPHFGCHHDLALTPDNSKLMTTGGYTVYVWDLLSYKCLFELNHAENVKAAALTPDGKKIIVGQALGDVVVWDISDSIPPQAPVVVEQQPKKGLFSKLGGIFSRPAASTQTNEDIPQTGEKLATLKGHAYRVHALTVTPDGKYVISGADEVKVWRLDRLEQPSESLAQHESTVQCLTVSPDGRYLASTEGSRIKIWDLPTRKILHTIHTVGYLGNAGCLVITPDSQRLIAGSLEAINFYNLKTGEKEDSVSVQGSLITALAISSDGKRLLSGGDRQTGVESGDTLRFWDIGGLKAKQIGALLDPSDNRESILEVAIIPDGKQALSIALEQLAITVWDLETKKIIKTLPPRSTEENRSSTFLDGTFDSVELEKSVSKSVNLCYSPFVLTSDGNYLIATSPLFFSIIDWKTGQTIAEVPPPKEGLRGQRHHASPITDIAVAPNGQWFVSASGDATIKVWELATGHNLATFSAESNLFTCCTVAPDNCTIIAGDVSGLVHFFQLEGFVEGVSVLISPPIVPAPSETTREFYGG